MSPLLVADFDLDDRGEVGVITGNQLNIYEQSHNDPVYSIALPENTAVVDVFDADLDGTADIVAVSGEKVIRIPITKDASVPIVCFLRKNLYSQYTGIPFPGVLVIMRQNTPLVALPCADVLELRSFKGELVDSYPIGMDAAKRLSPGQPFNVWTNQHAQLGNRDALEFRVSSAATFKPMLPNNALSLPITEASGRLGTARQQREAATAGPERWPWYPVNATEPVQIRALYARAEAPSGHTAIRIRRIPDGDGSGQTGPVRHFPGLILRHPGALPDFDGDGFNDLLLWKSQRISLTADGLARAATQRTWPIQIIAHAYAPEKARYRAKPMGRIEMDIPLPWYMDSGGTGPLKTIFLHDIDGDARTDFGCLTDPQTIAIWRFQEEGFSASPDFSHRFPESLDAVVFETDLDGQGRTTIALRSQGHLYLLRPNTRFTR
ncbi:MAG: VCBS repeat-containing protein [Candidatus Hydrogenedentes bacterium]|nr:VCBS repeat-containing protein [Candidatus Hydrogenedentota bacterium]